MDAESFFARWSKPKPQSNVEGPSKTDVPTSDEARSDVQLPAGNLPKAPPTLEDVATLTPESDFTPFVARGVDENVRRSALKKLFADPHFNVMDGLDVYIDDYGKSTPIPAAVLAALNHARALLNPLEHLENPLMRLIDEQQVAESEVHAEGAEKSEEPTINPDQDADDDADKDQL